MSKQRQALELALEAIKNPLSFGAFRLEAICDEIREALAEPEPEPVARVKTVGGYPDASEHTVEWLVKFKDVMSGQLLYTARPASKPLTDEEINDLKLPPNGCTMRELVRAIERAYGIGEE